MNKIIKKVKEYNNTNTDEIFNKIIDELHEKIEFFCLKVNPSYKDDIRQEILFAIFKKICNFKIFDKEILINKNYLEIINIYKQEKNKKYFKNFIKKYNLSEPTLEETNKDEIIDFLFEYYLFCEENKFKECVNMICRYKIIDYYRYIKSNKISIISLNELINEEELINFIPEIKEDEKVDIYKNNLFDNDREFLDNFIENDKLLTGTQVGKKLGISQQAICKRLKKIRENYRNL